jgi:hypothetical protein
MTYNRREVTAMASTSLGVEPRKEEAIVYLVISPRSGPGQRIYTDEDIQALGGIHAIEQSLENETYWYVRLGKIRGDAGRHGVTFQQSDFGDLPEPSESEWKTGRCNPAFRSSDVERHIFRTAFRAIGHMLDAWKKRKGGEVEAYALKELRISPQRLLRATRGLQTLQRIYEIAEITVIKFCYDTAWAEPQFPDLVLGEFSFRIPLQIRRSSHDKMFVVEVLPLASC